jgi:hypothetical protein
MLGTFYSNFTNAVNEERKHARKHKDIPVHIDQRHPTPIRLSGLLCNRSRTPRQHAGSGVDSTPSVHSKHAKQWPSHAVRLPEPKEAREYYWNYRSSVSKSSALESDIQLPAAGGKQTYPSNAPATHVSHHLHTPRLTRDTYRGERSPRKPCKYPVSPWSG